MDITRIGASGLIAAGQAVAVRANNIVNAQTPQFRPLAPVFSPINNGGGVALFTQRVDQQVNVLRESVGFMAAAQQYKAAANIMRRSEELAGAFLRAIG
jgi:flagellar basal body rod protein FlgC